MYNQPIRSDDENALELLKAKAEKLAADQKEMVDANKYFRKMGTMKGYGDLTDEQAEKIDNQILTGNSWEKQPYAAYILQNNRQNLRTLKGRIKSLEEEKVNEGEDREYDTEKYGFEVLENKEAMRLQLFFDGKPKEEVRTILKQSGFKWSPNNECWQRLLNNNARYAVHNVVSRIERQRNSGMEM